MLDDLRLEAEAEVGRSGRRRKDGPRYPSGGLKSDKPARSIDDKVRCGRQPHRRMLKEADRLDDRAESPLGRMLLKGLLTRAGEADRGEISDAARDRYEAGIMFAQIVGGYRATIGAPKSTAGSGVGRDCAGTCPALRELFGEDKVHCSCEEKKLRYDDAFEALSSAGRRLLLAVNRAAVHGQAIEPEELVNLIDGLDVLVRHLGLTPGRGLRHSRNAN